jgi:hypothetical protein
MFISRSSTTGITCTTTSIPTSESRLASRCSGRRVNNTWNTGS